MTQEGVCATPPKEGSLELVQFDAPLGRRVDQVLF